MLSVGQGHLEPFVSANPNDPRHIVATSFEDGTQSDDAGGPESLRVPHGANVYVSRDGGATWVTVALGDALADGAGDARVPSDLIWDVKPIVLKDGSVLVTGMTANLVDAYGPAAGLQTGSASSWIRERVFVARSTDGGSTFPEVNYVDEAIGALLVGACVDVEPTCVFGFGLNGFIDQPFMVQGPKGELLLTWYRYDSSPLPDPSTCYAFPSPSFSVAGCGIPWAAFSISEDGGRSWTTPAMIAEPGFEAAGATIPAIGPTGTYYLTLGAWADLRIAVSDDGGNTWTLRTVEGAPPSGGAFLWIQAREGEGHERLFVMYQSPGEDGSSRSVFLRSEDAGLTWSKPLVINDSDHAAMDIVGDDVPVISYYFTHPDGAKERRVLAVAQGRLSDHLVLDDAAATPDDRVRDYMGIAALPDGAYAVWMGREGGSMGIAGARVEIG